MLGTSAVWPVVARAEKTIPVIAILGSGAADAPFSKKEMSLLEAGLRELGLLQGRDYTFETRWAGSDAERFPALATELLAGNPRAVVVSTNLAALAVQSRSRTVPIVGTGLNAPVAIGLAESLAHPGGNVTGVASMAEDLELKLFAMMRETLPGLRKVLAITNPSNPSHPVMLDLLKQQAAKDGIAFDVAKVSAPADLEALYAQMAQQRPDAVFVLSDNSVLALSDRIIAHALALHLASFGSLVDSFAREGGLLAYSRDPRESFRGVARLLKRILDGANPAELPFEQPTKFNLFINLKSAKELGIEIPAVLLATADEVIE
jgi:putative ABC transport system substrate-binding protein